jgi:hypothetical protein
VIEPVFPIPRFDQIGLVVRDLEASMRRYWERFGIGPWRVYTYGPPRLTELTYRGRAQEYAMRLALCQHGPLVVELIQSIAGPNIYDEFLAAHGEGLHHVRTVVEDFAAAVARLEAAGYACIQSGRGFGLRGDGAFAYFDTTADLGMIYEVVELPKERVPPEQVYPPEQP